MARFCARLSGTSARILRRSTWQAIRLRQRSTAVAWSKHPQEFSEIQAMVMLQPVSARPVIEEFVKGIGTPDGYDKFDKAVHERTGFHLADQSPLEHVKAVTSACSLVAARLPRSIRSR